MEVTVKPGSIVINKRTSTSSNKYNFEGDNMTALEILSYLNIEAGGKNLMRSSGDCTSGCNLKNKGDFHSEGGVKTHVQGGSDVEIEKNEIVLVPEISSLGSYEFEGKTMTGKQIVSYLNEAGGGVRIMEKGGKLAKGGELPCYLYLSEIGGCAIGKKSELEKAKELSKTGTDNETTRQRTGWFINEFDGLWRFEISDKDVELLVDFDSLKNFIKENKDRDDYGIILNKVIKHPLLFNAYPEIKDIHINFIYNDKQSEISKVKLFYRDNNFTIIYNFYGEETAIWFREAASKKQRISKRLGVIIHEIQHIIQFREGLSGGTNQLWELRELYKEQGLHEGETEHTLQDHISAIAKKRCLNSSGELESRDAANRINLSDEERLNVIPFSDIDIDYENVTVRYYSPINFSKGGKLLYGGELSGNKTLLQQAKQLADNGFSNEEIRQKTGWFVNPYDKLWRYEINDSEMRLTEDFDYWRTFVPSRIKSAAFTISRIISHDKLFEAYPIIKDIYFELTYLPDKQHAFIETDLSSESKIGFAYNLYHENEHFNKLPKERQNTYRLNVIIHELQHIIQILEGFAGGGCVETYKNTLKEKQLSGEILTDQEKADLYIFETKKMLEYAGEIESMSVELRREMSDEIRKQQEPLKNVSLKFEHIFTLMEKKQHCGGYKSPPKFDDGGTISDKTNDYEIIYYISKKEHSDTYGIKAVKPLYIQRLWVNSACRNKGLGSKLLNEIEQYAKNNDCDIVFGHITQKSDFTRKSPEYLKYLNDVICIKQWLADRGYATNDENNDFHKVLNIEKMTNGGNIKTTEMETKSILNQKTDLLGSEKELWMYEFGKFSNYESKYKIAEVKYKRFTHDMPEYNTSMEHEWRNFKNIRFIKSDSKTGYCEIPLTEENEKLLNQYVSKKLAKITNIQKSPFDELNDYYFKEVRSAINNNKYQKAISEGRMTVSDAIAIIKSAGLEVPKEIIAMQVSTQFDIPVSEAKEALKIETEHKDTLEQVASGELTPEQAITKTVTDHLKENKDYYDKEKGLPAMEKKLSEEKPKEAWEMTFDEYAENEHKPNADFIDHLEKQIIKLKEKYDVISKTKTYADELNAAFPMGRVGFMKPNSRGAKLMESSLQKTIDNAVKSSQIRELISRLETRLKYYKLGRVNENGQDKVKSINKLKSLILATEKAITEKKIKDKILNEEEIQNAKNYLKTLKKDLAYQTKKYQTKHKEIVQQALSEGKSIPSEVLAEYPELRKEKQPIKIKSSSVNRDKLSEICKQADIEKNLIIAEVEDEDIEYYQSLGFKIIE